MTAILAGIRAGIAGKLTEAIAELQVSPYILSDPTPPYAHVFPDGVMYDLSFQRGHDSYTILLEVGVSNAPGDEGSQMLLDSYLEPFGPSSVKEAVEMPDVEDGRTTLGGACYDLHVVRVEGYRIYVREGRAPVLGAEWTIDVLSPGQEEA